VSTEANAAEVQPKAGTSWPPSLQALIAPDVGMERQVRAGSVWLPLCLATLCALSAGVSASFRVDAREATLQTLEMSGQLATQSDRQIEDATKAAERAFVVKRIAAAVVAPALWMCLIAFFTFILGWFARGRIQVKSLFPVAAAALLPFAVADLLEAGAILRHVSISSEPAPFVTSNLAQIAAALSHPVMGSVAKLLGVVDLFSLWSAVLIGFGLAAAGSIPTRRALSCALIFWVAWRLVRTFALGG